MSGETQLCLRIPQHLKDWLATKAKADERSLTFTITRMLRRLMEQDQEAAR
jgi:hypothetical protein